MSTTELRHLMCVQAYLYIIRDKARYKTVYMQETNALITDIIYRKYTNIHLGLLY